MDKHSALELLFEVTLRHQYNAEKAAYDTMNTLIEKAESMKLKQALQHHKEETKNQINRLQEVFTILDIDIRTSKLHGLSGIANKGKELIKTIVDLNFTDKSKSIDGILSEGKELLRHFANTDANDIAIIAAENKVEHAEIACYELICLLAERYGKNDVVKLMEESLNEEVKMAEKMSELALHSIKSFV